MNDTKQEESYRGWSNRATWTVRIWLTSDEVRKRAEDAADEGPEYLPEFTAELLRSAVQPGTKQAGFVMEVIENYLEDVNFGEIAESLTCGTR